MPNVIDRFGFLIHNPELFNHYRAVWRHLPPGSVDVAVTGPEHELPDIIAGCERHGLPWRDAREILGRQQRYTTLVSSFPVHYLRGTDSPYLVKSIGQNNLRFMYATGKAGWNFQAWNNEYDTILCFGPYHAERLRFCQHAIKIQMGYPRFDRFFNEPIDRAAQLRTMGLDPQRQTVVWLPTWHSLSSIDAFTSAVASLQNCYNVIVKPHPITITSEPERMQQLQAINCLIREHIDNVVLFQLADYLLCDYGGSAFGGIYTDRNVLLFDLPNAERDALTGADSADIRLRHDLPHLGIDEVDRLESMLADDTLWYAQREVRAKLSEAYFAPFHGFAAEVAALAITHAHARHARGG